MVIAKRRKEKEGKQIAYAIYENGIFRLIEPLETPFREKQFVRLTIEIASSLDLVANFYEGLSEEEIDEIENVILDRSNSSFPERDWSWADEEDEEA